jgi:ribonuclease HI
MNLQIHTDGGARGNPGPAAIGVVIEEILDHDKGNLITQFGLKIGETTNNVAEYRAVIEAFKYLINHKSKLTINGESVINFYADSSLIVNQLNGNFKIKLPHLRELMLQVRSLENEIGGIIKYNLIPREQNSQADFQVNKILDM